MTDKDALELLNMFTTAAQIVFKKAFPFMKDNVSKQCIIKNLLANN